jgi:hypothetical protein
MSNFAKLAAETSDRYLAALAEGQETYLKSIAAFSSTWTTPAAPAAFSGLPTIREIPEVNFAFAEKLLKQQQDFVTKVLGAVETAPTAASTKASAKTKAS